MKEIDFNQLKQKLPLYPELIDKDEYFNSSVLITIAKIKDEHCFIFEKRSAGIRQGGEVSFPGGEVDKDEDKNHLETAIRETVEELGIKKEKIKVIGQLGMLMIPGVLVNAFFSEFYIDDKENKFELLPVEKLNLPPRYSKPWGKIKRKVYFYKYNGEVIWGLTAALVKKVVEILEVQ